MPLRSKLNQHEPAKEKCKMTMDHSADWNAAADQFIAIRSNVGAALVLAWGCG